jgi:hypothetical protein
MTRTGLDASHDSDAAAIQAAPKTMQLRHFVKPLLYSLGTFLLAAVAIGALVLPAEIKEIRSPDVVAIHQLVADRQSGYALVVYRCAPVNGDGIKYKLGVRDLSAPLLTPVHEFTDIAPNCLLASGQRMFVGEFDGTVRSYGLGSGFPSEVVGTQRADAVAGLAASADGQLLLSWGESLYVWDITTKSLLRKLPFHSHFALLTAGSKSYLCDEPALGEIVERDLESGAILRTLAKDTHVTVAALSPDSSQLAWIDSEGMLSLVSLPSGKMAWRHGGRDGEVLGTPLMFSPDGSRIVSRHASGLSSSNVLSIWNADTGDLQQSLPVGMERVTGAAFSGSEQLYVWSPDGQLQQWDLGMSNAAREAAWKTTHWQTAP